MLLKITMRLMQKEKYPQIPFNYQYPLAAAIHQIMHKSDAKFADFFHNIGYGRERYKLFTFSNITVPFIGKRDRMLLLGDEATFKICFHVPEAAQHFIMGIFINEQIFIQDKMGGVQFRVREIESCTNTLPESTQKLVTVVVQPISPLVVSGRRPNPSAPCEYYSPYELAFVERLNFSWIQKFKTITSASDAEIDLLKSQIKTEVLFFNDAPIERRLTIKADHKNAHKIRGYTRFALKLTAPREMIHLALDSGLGVKNSVGMGCIQLINYK